MGWKRRHALTKSPSGIVELVQFLGRTGEQEECGRNVGAYHQGAKRGSPAGVRPALAEQGIGDNCVRKRVGGGKRGCATQPAPGSRATVPRRARLGQRKISGNVCCITCSGPKQPRLFALVIDLLLRHTEVRSTERRCQHNRSPKGSGGFMPPSKSDERVPEIVADGGVLSRERQRAAKVADRGAVPPSLSRRHPEVAHDDRLMRRGGEDTAVALRGLL